MIELEGIDHVALAVRDVEQSARWYIDVLGFEHRWPGMWDGVPVFVGRGTTALALFPLRDGGDARARGAGMLHLAFRTTRAGFVAAQGDLKERGISFTFADHEISHSIYFRDPDGHELEITTYQVG
jgi:catechol 2,3-dioxygenase-like lactoylglutathione lyase family enzyme